MAEHRLKRALLLCAGVAIGVLAVDLDVLLKYLLQVSIDFVLFNLGLFYAAEVRRQLL